jgi:hypothetical protein
VRTKPCCSSRRNQAQICRIVTPQNKSWLEGRNIQFPICLSQPFFSDQAETAFGTKSRQHHEAGDKPVLVSIYSTGLLVDNARRTQTAMSNASDREQIEEIDEPGQRT